MASLKQNHLVEILLPLPPGPISLRDHYEWLRGLLVDHFGGLTAFTRSPAEGVWRSGGGEVDDQIVTVEVMARELDAAWWAELREELERRLSQKEIVIRAHAIARL